MHGSISTADVLSRCRLCPRQCGVDRGEGQVGYCRAGRDVEVYRHGPHFGEEPPLSGTGGSGTVFFSRCTLRCLYCQNFPWSQQGQGARLTCEELAHLFLELQGEGCHNLNLVSPTPWLGHIRDALTICKDAGFGLPIVYNTSGFERGDILEWFGGYVSVYLTDLRYASRESAREGSEAEDYVEVAREALATMWRLAGPVVVDGEGVIQTGTICRILVLPGRSDEAIENLRWIADNLGDQVAVSVMAQYTPAHRAAGRPSWGRKLQLEEYEPVCREVESLGFEVGWVQELDEKVDPDMAGFRMPPGHDVVG